MSDDRLEDRNRNLKMEGYTGADLINAVVSEGDSEEVARYKIAQYRGSLPNALPTYGAGIDVGSSGGGGGTKSLAEVERTANTVKYILYGIGFFLVNSILVALWSMSGELFQHLRTSWHAASVEEQMKDYSDFSKLSDWPASVQAIYRQQEGKPLGKLMDEVPSDTGKLSADKRHKLGAQIWFKISSKGAGANEFLNSVQDAPHRVDSPMLRAGSLSIKFLKTECEKGVEAACLDAAKSYAALVWWGKGFAGDARTIEIALDQLPSSGPLAKSSAIEALRAKLTDFHASLKK